MRYRIRREWILEAILAAKESEKGRLVISTEPLTGVSMDMAQDLLVRCEHARWRRERPHVGQELRNLVGYIVRMNGRAPDKARAYELIMMRYYRILKSLVDRRRKELKEARAAKAEALKKLREEADSSP